MLHVMLHEWMIIMICEIFRLCENRKLSEWIMSGAKYGSIIVNSVQFIFLIEIIFSMIRRSYGRNNTKSKLLNV